MVTPYGNTILVTIGSVNGFTSLVPGHCMQGWGQFNFNSRNWNWWNWKNGIRNIGIGTENGKGDQNFTTITAALTRTRTRTRIVFHGTNSSCKRYAWVSSETWSLPPVVWWQKPWIGYLFPFEWTGGLKMVTLNIGLSSWHKQNYLYCPVYADVI